MLSLATLLSSLGLTALAVAVWTLIYFFAYPLYRMRLYKCDETESYFHPGVGYAKYLKDNFKRAGDVMASSKEAGRSEGGKKILVTNEKNRAFIVISDPAHLKQFCQHPQFYKKGAVARSFRLLSGMGIFQKEGEPWKLRKKLISQSFNYNFLVSTVPVVQRLSQRLFNRVTPEAYGDYSIIDRVQEITGISVGHIFFGESFDNYTFEGKPLTTALAGLISELGLYARSSLVILFGYEIIKLPIIPKFKRLMDRISKFRHLCGTIIENHRAKPNKEDKDLLTSLLVAQESGNDSDKLTDENIIDEFITFFVAGMDTTGHLVGMTLYHLARNPQYLDALKEERNKTYNLEKNVTADTLQKMDMLHAVLKETLRVHPPSPGLLGREVVQDHQLGGLKIRKGDIVKVDFIPALYNEKDFPEPEKFKPERWNTIGSNLDPYAFIPFSAGPRNCPGQHLAILEAKVIVSEFLERFDFKLPDDYNLSMVLRFMYEPLHDVKFRLTPVNS